MRIIFAYAFIAAVVVACNGCSTAVNGTVAAYEGNIATSQKAAGQNTLNAKIFALCMTPVFDLPYTTAGNRKAIRDACTPSDSATDAQSTVDAMGSVAAPAK